jgi:hypothetical protein
MKKDQEIDKAYNELEAIHFRDMTVKSSCIPLLQTTGEGMKEDADVKRSAKSDVELIQISDDHSDEIPHNFEAGTVTEHKASPKKNDFTGDDVCYFCKNALFYCHHIISCTSTIKSKRGGSGCFKPLDLCALDNLSEANVIEFDLRQLLDLASSLVDEDCDRNIDVSGSSKELASDCNTEISTQVQSHKSGGNMKLNFNLDLALFEQCLLQDELLPGRLIDNLEGEVAVPEVGQKILDSAVNVCHRNGCKNSDSIEIESRRDSMIPPERKMKRVRKSPGMCHSSVAAGIGSKPLNTEYSPLRDGQAETCLYSTNHSPKETPNKPCKLLLSPVSPILGSVLKDVVHKPTQPLPVCSTPKIHKKNLFLGNVMLRPMKEEGGNFTSSTTQHLEVEGEKSVNALMAGDCETLLRLTSPVSYIASLPRPNFDLFSVTQELVSLKPDEERTENFRNEEVCMSTTQDSTMCTVTQLLGMVSKTVSMVKGKEFGVTSQQNTSVDVEELILPSETVEGVLSTEERSKPVQECSYNVPSSDVPSRFSKSHNIAHVSSDSINCAFKDNPSSSSDSVLPESPVPCSQVRKFLCSSASKMTTPSLSCPAVQEMPVDSEKKSEQKYMEHDYLHDGDDDIFADLAMDCHTFTACKRSSSVTSAVVHGVCTVDNLPEADKCDRSEHQEVAECGDDVALKQVVDPVLDSVVAPVTTIVPGITKLSVSAVSNSLQTTAITKSSHSRLSLKCKLKESAKVTCMENLSVKVTESSSDIIACADVKRRNFDKENPSKIIWDENQFAEVSNTASKTVFFDTQKEKNGSKSSEGKADWFVSFGMEKTTLHNKSISENERVTCRAATLDDDSPVTKPHVRNKKINISSSSNESGVLSSCDTNFPLQNTTVVHEKVKDCKSLPVKHSDWLTARKSNSPRLTADVKNNSRFSGNRHMDSCVQVMKTDVIKISLEDDSDFESQKLVRLKKRKQGKDVYTTDRNESRGKTTHVNKKSEVSEYIRAFIVTQCPCSLT